MLKRKTNNICIQSEWNFIRTYLPIFLGKKKAGVFCYLDQINLAISYFFFSDSVAIDIYSVCFDIGFDGFFRLGMTQQFLNN